MSGYQKVILSVLCGIIVLVVFVIMPLSIHHMDTLDAKCVSLGGKLLSGRDFPTTCIRKDVTIELNDLK